jgi:hypothetical protein
VSDLRKPEDSPRRIPVQDGTGAESLSLIVNVAVGDRSCGEEVIGGMAKRVQELVHALQYGSSWALGSSYQSN